MDHEKAAEVAEIASDCKWAYASKKLRQIASGKTPVLLLFWFACRKGTGSCGVH